MTIEAVYDQNCKFILDILEEFKDKFEIKTYDFDHFKEKKKAIPIMTNNGTKNLPLMVITSGDLEKVLWSENKPDWKTEIDNFLKLLEEI